MVILLEQFKPLRSGFARLVYAIELDAMARWRYVQVPAVKSIIEIKPGSIYAQQLDLLPSRTNECGFCIIGWVPCANTELEPAFCVNGEIDGPEPPSVIMLFFICWIKVISGNKKAKPSLSFVLLGLHTKHVPCEKHELNTCYTTNPTHLINLPIWRYFNPLHPVSPTAVGPTFQLYLTLVYNDRLILREYNCAPEVKLRLASIHSNLG